MGPDEQIEIAVIVVVAPGRFAQTRLPKLLVDGKRRAGIEANIISIDAAEHVRHDQAIVVKRARRQTAHGLRKWDLARASSHHNRRGCRAVTGR